MVAPRREVLSIAIAAAVVAGGCNAGGGSPDAAAVDARPPGPGQVTMSWTLVAGEDTVSCEDIKAVSVAFTAIPIDAFTGEVRTRSCASGEGGVSFDLAPGTYTGRVDLVSVAGVIGEPVRFDGIVVESGEEVALDPFVFEVSRTGGASFRIEARPFDDNCSDEDSPPIEELFIELRERGGDCVPIEFQVEDSNGDFAGTFESDCAGARTGCIERDQTISFEGVEPGRYLLDVVAQDEGGACLGILNQFEIAGGGLIAPLGALVLDASEDCGGSVVPDAGVPDAGPEPDAAEPEGAGDGS